MKKACDLLGKIERNRRHCRMDCKEHGRRGTAVRLTGS
jgi:hypothetical protein